MDSRRSKRKTQWRPITDGLIRFGATGLVSSLSTLESARSPRKEIANVSRYPARSRRPNGAGSLRSNRDLRRCFVWSLPSPALWRASPSLAPRHSLHLPWPAAILPMRAALLVVTAAWIVNQAIGFGSLGYPLNANTILWGFAIGLAAAAINRDFRSGAARAPANRKSRGAGLGLGRGLCGL